MTNTLRFRTNRLVRAASGSGAAIASGRLVFMVSQVLIARWLGPYQFGLFTLGWTVTSLANLFAPLGLPQTVVRFQLFGKWKLLRWPLLVAGLSSSLAAIGIAGGSEVIASVVFDDPETAQVIFDFAPCIFTFSICMVSTASVRAAGYVIGASLVQGLLPFSAALLALALFRGIGYVQVDGCVEAYVLGFGISALAALVWSFCLREVGSEDNTRWQTKFTYGIYLMLANSFVVINFIIDRVMLGILGNTSDVGIYQVASQLPLVTALVMAAVGNAFEPLVPQLIVQERRLELAASFRFATRVVVYALLPGMLLLAVMSDRVIVLLFGQDFAPAAVPLSILSIGQLIRSSGAMSVVLLSMTEHQKTALGIGVFVVVLNIVGNAASIPLIGINGAALATAIANAVGGGLAMHYVRRRVGLEFEVSFVPATLAGGLTLIALGCLSLVEGLNNLIGIAVALFIAYFVFLISIYVFTHGKDEILMAVLSNIKNIK